MGYPDTFDGYAVESKQKWSDFRRISYKPKRFEEFDIDIEITHCGVCASDLHTINAGWGDPDYPVVAGHEIVGKVLKVGPKVKTIKVGDRVGVGAQVWACLDCRIVPPLVLLASQYPNTSKFLQRGFYNGIDV